MNPLYRVVSQYSRTRSFRLLFQSSWSSSSSSNEVATSSDWPRPKEIPFQSKVANCVNLIGYVCEPIQFHASPDHKFWAATVITQHLHRPSHSPDFWIPILFEGDLAHVASRHLKLNDHVYVSGELTADLPPIDVSQGKAPVQIMVQNVNFVQGSSEIVESYGHRQKEQDFLHKQLEEETSKDSGRNRIIRDGDGWRNLVDNPKEWWDYRSSKRNGSVNPRHPDFKCKDGGFALWLDRAPSSVLRELEKLEFDVQVPKPKQVKQHKGDEYWTDLIDNPKKWWDNRLNKRNVKAPDFKHKESGVGLWLNDSPTWVHPQLPPLETTHHNVAASK